ncbi:SMI1/KNR4 family protein [Micromonospora sp. NBC_01796]|uniref:SMI1/KNR4 family protein n=1 Tax=Micromonospora sp. NBC_01796 TaxID=2975987 RepID=UPI002DD85F0B|nr:SMI1/KNR4 family protein [Micromonospora sp. NBC_01796]WSA83236.1 SMI1/KNR4 family protein [Micromonospora sp. NBC_01796]
MAKGPLQRSFPELDLDTFWDDSDYAMRAYVDGPPSDGLVASVEVELGFRLPALYVALMRLHNGGMPRNTCCPAPKRTTWADDHVAVSGIMGIGRQKDYSLAGSAGSRFWIDEWGYPAIGVYFADCPSAGHDMIASTTETADPAASRRWSMSTRKVDYRVTVLAPNFVSFVQALRPEEDYDVED